MKELIKKALLIYLMITLIPLSVFIFKPSEQIKFKIYDAAEEKVLSLSQREYVLGALCSEMPPTFHTEALCAQAVAIYTNAYRSFFKGEEYVARVNTKSAQGFVTNGELKKRWGKNFDYYYNKMQKAVDLTLGKVITYEEKPILAAYHSQSSGKTESAENVWGGAVPYLVPADSEGDTFSPNHTEKNELAAEQVREILQNSGEKLYLPQDNTLLFTDFEFSPSGTLLSVTVGNAKMSGQKIRRLFNLKSAAVTVSCDKDNIIFTTKGYGHGVGLSQYGADFMARQGKNWREILSHYYLKTEIMQSGAISA